MKCLHLAEFSIGLIVLCSGAASGQPYPNKPVRIVTAEPGGSVGIAARLVAQGITGSLGQNVIVDNRGTAITADLVSKAPADGYTLLVIGSTLWIAPLLQKVPYDALRDFLPISLLASTPNILVVHPSLPAKSVRELIALAKARPGALNYSSGVSGAPSHLAGELFKFMAGVDIVHVPYKAAAPALTDVIRGEIQLMFSNATSATPHIKSGRLRALGVTSSEPSSLAPGMPTVAASGLPGFEAVSVTAAFAPAKTPEPIIQRLNQTIVQFLNTAEAKKQFLDTGTEAISCTPEQLTARMKSEVALSAKVIQRSGIRAE